MSDKKNTKKNRSAMNGLSPDIKTEKILELKQILPEIFSEDKIDIDKLKLTLGDSLDTEGERYHLDWAGKSDAFRAIQTSTSATLAPAPEESVNFDDTQNVFIEGENLEVLKTLQKSYHGKIKMIYIDPPYNTGNDSFIYPDKFSESKDEYLKRIEDKDESGYLLKEGLFRKNSKENGHYHSNWLSMMYPRLFLARNLLRDDGVIFVSIDDNEVHNLRLMMNEIFGEENFVAQLVWKKKYTGGKHAKYFVDLHEYILVYTKQIESFGEILINRPEEEKAKFTEVDEHVNQRGKFYVRPLKSNLEERKTLVYPIKMPDGSIIETQWLVGEERFEREVSDGRILFRQKKNGEYQVYKKYYEKDNEGKVKPESLILKFPNNDAKVELKDLFEIKEGRDNLFYTVKPKELIKYLISQIVEFDDIILDFFAGSGTTAHAVLDLNKEDGGNRKFICVQLPEKTGEDSEAYKAGYKTIAEIGKERIRRVIKKIKDEEKQLKLEKKELDLGFKVFKLQRSNFKLWRGDIIENGADLEKQLDIFRKPVKPSAAQTNILWELIIKSGYDLTTKIEKKKTADGKTYHSIADGETIIALDKLDSKTVKEIIKQTPKKLITLDSSFDDNDQLKTNTALQLKDAGVEFRVV